MDLTNYNKEIRRDKQVSWRQFCEETTSARQGAHIHTVLAESNSHQPGLLKTPDRT